MILRYIASIITNIFSFSTKEVKDAEPWINQFLSDHISNQSCIHKFAVLVVQWLLGIFYPYLSEISVTIHPHNRLSMQQKTSMQPTFYHWTHFWINFFLHVKKNIVESIINIHKYFGITVISKFVFCFPINGLSRQSHLVMLTMEQMICFFMLSVEMAMEVWHRMDFWWVTKWFKWCYMHLWEALNYRFVSVWDNIIKWE